MPHIPVCFPVRLVISFPYPPLHSPACGLPNHSQRWGIQQLYPQGQCEAVVDVITNNMNENEHKNVFAFITKVRSLFSFRRLDSQKSVVLLVQCTTTCLVLCDVRFYFCKSNYPKYVSIK